MPAEEDLYDFIANNILRLFATSNLKDTELLGGDQQHLLSGIFRESQEIYIVCTLLWLVPDHRTKISMAYLTGAQSMLAK